MIQHFDAKLREQGFYLIVDISTLRGTTCNTGLPVYDFDAITHNISSLLRIGTPKSVDAIYMKNDKAIYFIEMSSMKSVINSIKANPKYTTDDEKIEAIQKKFKSTYLEYIDKVYESYSSIIAFWGFATKAHADYEVHSSFYAYFMDKTRLHIGCILLTDFDSRDELVYNFAYLMDTHKFCARRFGEMTLYNCDDFKREIVNA